MFVNVVLSGNRFVFIGSSCTHDRLGVLQRR
jgi:hypothetical protein